MAGGEAALAAGTSAVGNAAGGGATCSSVAGNASDGKVADMACYVLFDGYTDALALFNALRNAGVGVRVSPTPRQARSECGSALLLERCADRGRVEALASERGLAFQSIVELPCQINAARDRFC